MKKKTVTLILSILLSITFASTTVIPTELFAATATKTTTAKKVITKGKKRVFKKKTPSVDLNPPLITLATAPHSARKVYKSKKRVTKKTTKKK